jgi:hypothetical protein
MFKFRVWDKIEKHMYQSEDVLCLKLKKGEFGACVRDRNNGAYEKILKKGEHEIYLYTQIDDKNGEEIYENAIVKGPKGLAHVLYKNGSFRIQWKEYGYSDLYDSAGRIEVVGSVQENLKLLEVK